MLTGVFAKAVRHQNLVILYAGQGRSRLVTYPFLLGITSANAVNAILGEDGSILRHLVSTATVTDTPLLNAGIVHSLAVWSGNFVSRGTEMHVASGCRRRSPPLAVR
jgi:hypothetical protein